MKKRTDLLGLIVSGGACLLPMILSAALYSRLPAQIAVHWDSAGNPDGYAHKAFAAFGLPLLLLGIHLITLLSIRNDPKRANASAAIKKAAMWIIPVMSLIITPVTLFIALGINIPISLIVPALVGLLFILLGNYLPKCRQNYTIGIRLPWTLHDADNWNKTHRLAGYLFIAGGIVIIAGTFLSLGSRLWGMASMGLLLLLAVIPMIYSFVLYKRSGDKE